MEGGETIYLEENLDTPLVGEDFRKTIQQLKRSLYFVLGFLVFVAAAALCLGVYSVYALHIEIPRGAQTQSIRIIHFSDFYQVQGVPKFHGDNQLLLGGMSRLATIVKQQTVPYLLLFGGDLFFPSAMSTYLKPILLGSIR